ncbi:hypothetical protein ACA910_015805 [Epithemia clementina (nom. ined.)]
MLQQCQKSFCWATWIIVALSSLATTAPCYGASATINSRRWDRTNVRGAATLEQRRAQGVEADTPKDIFDNLNDNGNNDGGNSTPGVTCARPDQYGDFGVETPYTDAALVAWTYQIQGLLEMTVPVVSERIIPEIETRLSAKLMEVLFNTSLCEGNGDDPLISSQLMLGGVRNLMGELKPLVLENGSEVTGLLKEPRDTIRNGHDGISCENPEYIENARRCFKLIGGLTMTGRKGDIDQAVALAQQAIQSIMNDMNFLDKAHTSLLNVYYIAPEPDYHMYFGGGDPEPSEPVVVPQSPQDPEPDGVENNDDSGKSVRDWPVWPFLAIGGSLVLGVVIVFFLWHRRQGSFGQIRNKHSRRLLSLSPSSDDSGISSRSSENADQQYNILSNTWRNIGQRNETANTEKKTECSSDDAATADRSTSSASHFFDEGRSSDSDQQSFVVSGAFADTQSSPVQISEALLGSGSDKGSYDTSVVTPDHVSSNYSADNDGNSTEDDSSDASSSPSDTSPQQLPPRRLRRSVL